MSVQLRGKKYHYRFRLKEHRFSGVCENCTTEKDALKFEEQVYAEKLKEYEALQREKKRIRQNKTIVALVENYKLELSGGRRILLEEAYALSQEKPSKRMPSEHIIRQKQRFWNDFLAFMKATYPEITAMTAVRKCHCESYIAYLIKNGRFVKDVTFQARRNDGIIRAGYRREYKLAGKTIHEIARVCKEVFTKLSEDVGIVMNPWANVITPEWKQTDREIFSESELALIKRAIFRDDELSEFCRPLFLVAAVTGLTEGDICTLKWDEISWATRMIFRKRRKTGIDMAIPILSALVNYLKTLPRRGGYVFPVHAEMYLHDASLVSYRIKRFLEGLGIKTTKKPEGRRAISVKDLHSMRHVFCYYAGQAGIPLSTVQSIVGHMTPEMTRHYMAHVSIKAKQEAIEKLPEFLIFNSTADQPENLSIRQRIAELAYSLPEDELRSILQKHEKKFLTVLA